MEPEKYQNPQEKGPRVARRAAIEGELAELRQRLKEAVREDFKAFMGEEVRVPDGSVLAPDKLEFAREAIQKEIIQLEEERERLSKKGED